MLNFATIKPASDKLTVLTATNGALATKRHKLTETGIETEQYGRGFKFAVDQTEISSIRDLHDVIEALQDKRTSFLIRGEPVDGIDPKSARRLLYDDPKNGDRATFSAVMRNWFMVDVDGVEAPDGIDPVTAPEEAVEWLLGLLPTELRDASCVWQWSSSQGVKPGNKLSCHLFFWNGEPLTDAQLDVWAKYVNRNGQIIDPAVYRAVQPHYVAAPDFVGMDDPLPRRIGIREGLSDVAYLELPDFAEPEMDFSATVPAADRDAIHGGFEARLAEIGGPSGFRSPITAAAAYYLSGRQSPDIVDLKNRMRVAISRANSGTRSDQQIQRYMSDQYLDGVIDWIRTRETSRSQGGGFDFDLTAPLSSNIDVADALAVAGIDRDIDNLAVETDEHDDVEEMASAMMLKAPDGYAGQPMKWDAVTCAFVPAAPEPAQKPAADYDLLGFAVDRMRGKAPERRYLVQDIFPLSVPCVIAGAGSTGKSMATLDLALKVAEWSGKGKAPRAFGGDIATSGRVVIISSEDDWDEFHRRIDALDPTGSRRAAAGDKLLLVPFAAIGFQPLAKETSSGLEWTEAFDVLQKKLEQLDDLVMLVLDPFSVFFHINQSDTSQAYTVMSRMGGLANSLDASVFLIHHFAKMRDDIKDPSEARSAVKGNTAIVDGSRCTYAIWETSKGAGEEFAAALGVEFRRKAFVSGGVVKANYKHDENMHTYYRPPDTPALEEVTQEVKRGQIDRGVGDAENLARHLAQYAEAGNPYTSSGAAGLFDRRHELPEPFVGYSRQKLGAAAAALVEHGLIQKVRDRSRRGAPWVYDAEGGPYDRHAI